MNGSLHCGHSPPSTYKLVYKLSREIASFYRPAQPVLTDPSVVESHQPTGLVRLAFFFARWCC